MAEDLYFAGFRDITNTDVSKVVISQMQKRHLDKAELRWLAMDVAQQLEFGDASFDLVFDKGTLDSLLCADDADERCERALREVARCLRPGASFVCVSYGAPINRMCYFDKPAYGWTVQTPALIPKPQLVRVDTKDEEDTQHTMYVCTKYAQ